MIFLPDSVLVARRKLAAQLAARELEPEVAFEQALQWDPDDGVALMILCQARERAGDLGGAEKYAWRGLEAHPCSFRFYFSLAHLLVEQNKGRDLADGLLELGARKLLCNENTVEDLGDAGSEWVKRHPGDAGWFLDPETLDALASGLARRRSLESPGVTDLLRPYRLIHELQEDTSAGLDRVLVDRILENAAQCLPLLIGVLREWAEGGLREGDDFTAEVSLALLGEIGDPEALPALLEFVVLDEEPLARTSDWAIARIASRRPAEALDAFRTLAPGAGVTALAAAAEHLARMPPTAGAGEVLLGFLERLGKLPKPNRNELFPLVIAALLKAEGPWGRERARSAIDQHSGLLSRNTRATCHQLVEVHAVQPQLLDESLAQDSDQRSVYDICCKRRRAIAGGGGSRHVPRRSFPGRNDPCWCGSGKKYKKCHLAADELGPWGQP